METTAILSVHHQPRNIEASRGDTPLNQKAPIVKWKAGVAAPALEFGERVTMLLKSSKDYLKSEKCKKQKARSRPEKHDLESSKDYLKSEK